MYEYITGVIGGSGRKKRDTVCQTACADVPQLYMSSCEFDCMETNDTNVNTQITV